VVGPANVAPIANGDGISVDEDDSVSDNATWTDPDNSIGELTFALVTDVTNGTLVFNADGSYTYTPDADYNGGDSFTYTVNDSRATSAPGTVTITVNPINDQVVAVDVDGGSTDEDVATMVDVKVGVSDVEDLPAAMSYTADAVSVNGGTVVNNGDGTFTYTPFANFNGTDTFDYTVTDNGDGASPATSATATVTIVVDPVNDQVVALDVDAGSTDEDTAATIDVKGAVSDVEDLPAAMSYTGDAVSANGGTVVNNADGTFTYTPAANFHGTDSFDYTVTDNGDGADPATSATATVTIEVNAVNDPVQASDVDGGSLDEDSGSIVVDVKGSVFDITDLPADMSYTADAVSANGGTVVNNGDGTFTYTPAADFNGTDTFDYTVTDNGDGSDVTTTSATATVTVTVDPVNDQVVAVDVDGGSTDEDVATTVDVKVGVSDVEDLPGAMSYTADAVSANGGTVVNNGNGTFTYTPFADWYGTDTFTYTVTDNGDGADVATTSASAVVTIEVLSVNDAPVANDDVYSVDEGEQILVLAPGLLGNDTDISGDGLVANLVTGPAHGTVTVNSDGSFVYTHDGSETNSDSFTYTATDDGVGSLVSNVATVHLTVNAQNDPPVAVDDSGYEVDEDGTLVVGSAAGVRANDSDAEVSNAGLTVSLVTGPTFGSLSLNPDGSFTYVHGGDEFATSDSFVYELSDGALTDQATATIVIHLFNDAPVVDGVADDSITEAETFVVGVIATDAEGATLTYSLAVDPATANASIDSATGVVTFSPSAWNPIELGTYDFVVTVSDGIDETSIAFSITVTRSQAVCDVDNNGLCQAFDATLVLMHRVGLLLGPAPFNPLTDSQLLAADMNFDESVDAFDASLILRAVVSPKDETPIGTPNGVIAFGSIEQVDGGYLVPVVLSGNSSNLRSVEFVLTFDPTVMSVQGIQEKLGEAGWLVVHNADNVAGTLHVVSAGAVDAVDGDLFSILVSTENSDALKSMQAQTAMNAEGLAAMSAVDVVDVPESYSLSQNYPNPFNPTTTIQYQLPENVAVTVGVYDMQGRLIRMLVQQDQPAGTYSVQWDGRSSTGNQVASGVYVYQIRTGAFVATRRMILVK
jgi:VCBS repeat-containing protein